MSKDSLENLKDSIEKSGFPLEMRIGEMLTANEWHVDHDAHYYDYDEYKFRELDIKAFKYIEGIDFNLYISCKQSADRTWVFFSPKSTPSLLSNNLKYLPDTSPTKGNLLAKLLSFAEQSIFSKYFKMNDAISLKHALFKGNKTIDDSDIRSALFSATKALFSDNLGILGTKFRRINIPIIIYEGKLFVYSYDKKLSEVRSLRYLHFCPITNFQAFKDYENIGKLSDIWGSRYLVEIMNTDVILDYINKIESFAKELSKEDLSVWGNPFVTLKSIMPDPINNKDPSDNK